MNYGKRFLKQLRDGASQCLCRDCSTVILYEKRNGSFGTRIKFRLIRPTSVVSSATAIVRKRVKIENTVSKVSNSELTLLVDCSVLSTVG